MNAYPVAPDTHLLIIKRGEKVIESIMRFCHEHNIVNAELSGLGAVDEIECGYYDLENRVYEMETYQGMFEVVNISANVMRKEEDIFVHMHAVFTDEQNNSFGGHVQEMRVGVTLEVIVRQFHTTLKREFDDETGLFLVSGH